MILIIDGYNILKFFYHDAFITEKQRTDFIQLLMKYGKKKGHELIVVFDGGAYGLPDRWVQAPVTIMYTGKQERADDVIIRLLKQYKTYEVVIVSTDREITKEAEECNVPFIDSSLFFDCVKNVVRTSCAQPQKKSHVQKMHKELNPVLDALMETVEIPSRFSKDDTSLIASRSRGKKMSKHEQRIMNIVEKL